jgi:hypothetical protein
MLPTEILNGLTSIANDWRWLSISWHVSLGALLLTLVAGWRPSARVLSRLLVAPLVSVSVVAWLSGNPFNGTMFAVLAGTLAFAARCFSNAPGQLAGSMWAAAGVAFVAFGWTYPHFLNAASWTSYLYAAPFGLLPCPTLSVVIGMTFLVRELRSRLWTGSLALAGLLYGAFGVLRLGVTLDWVLLCASVLLAAVVISMKHQ